MFAFPFTGSGTWITNSLLDGAEEVDPVTCLVTRTRKTFFFYERWPRVTVCFNNSVHVFILLK